MTAGTAARATTVLARATGECRQDASAPTGTSCFCRSRDGRATDNVGASYAGRGRDGRATDNVGAAGHLYTMKRRAEVRPTHFAFSSHPAFHFPLPSAESGDRVVAATGLDLDQILVDIDTGEAWLRPYWAHSCVPLHGCRQAGSAPTGMP
jgi:hypothetical protein